MISVIHVITGLNTGGAERMLVKLLEGLDRSRFDPVVVSLMDEGTQGAAIRALGIPVHTLEMRPSCPSPLALFRLRHLLWQLAPDVVHGWMYHGGLAALFAKGHAGAVVGIRHSIYDIRNENPATRLVIRTLRRFAARADCVVYNAVVSARQHEALGYPADKSLVIHNGFDCELFRPDCDAGKRIRSELGIDGNAQVIGHLSRFSPMKDHANFLRAAAMVAQTNPRVCFVLAGTGVDAGNPALSALMHDTAFKGRVHLLGERSDAPALYNAMDVFCSSSWSEAFPNVLGEAMACGVRCVATDVGDSVLVLGDTGRVVPARDAEALAAALREMLDMEHSVRCEQEQAARNRVLEHFNLKAVVREYESLLERIVDAHRR
jgi:glycosyltransferase involved in cell wall biosynthesis